jgi:hypothetical protein
MSKRGTYSHKALRMPQFPIRVDNLLMRLKPVPTAGAEHVPQRHADTVTHKRLVFTSLTLHQDITVKWKLSYLHSETSQMLGQRWKLWWCAAMSGLFWRLMGWWQISMEQWYDDDTQEKTKAVKWTNQKYEYDDLLLVHSNKKMSARTWKYFTINRTLPTTDCITWKSVTCICNFLYR